ncbi:MAG TPA: hypothetical protein DF774_11475 [Rheinheimera sp.]|nr:hypothetical protein [Rheinheimera sp.]
MFFLQLLLLFFLFKRDISFFFLFLSFELFLYDQLFFLLQFFLFLPFYFRIFFRLFLDRFRFFFRRLFFRFRFLFCCLVCFFDFRIFNHAGLQWRIACRIQWHNNHFIFFKKIKIDKHCQK